MMIERIKVLELCAGRPNNVVEEVEAVFHSPVPQRLNLFDYKRIEKLCVHYKTTWSGSAQTHMLIREIEASPFVITVDLTSSGEGSLESGGPRSFTATFRTTEDTDTRASIVSPGLRLEIASSLIRAMQ